MVFTKSDFDIDEEILSKYWDIIDLILSSETIETKDQKKYWIDSLSTMTDEQIDNLKSILIEEKEELQKIDEKYKGSWSATSTSAASANTKDANEEEKQRIKAEKQRQKRREMREAEKEHEQQEEKLEEDILKGLDDL